MRFERHGVICCALFRNRDLCIWATRLELAGAWEPGLPRWGEEIRGD